VGSEDEALKKIVLLAQYEKNDQFKKVVADLVENNSIENSMAKLLVAF
jgi:hypothetical protein